MTVPGIVRRGMPALALALAACASGATAPAQSPPPGGHVHWSYDGEAGPGHWADLDPAWAVARTGTRQSPIDLVASTATVGTGPALAVSWRPGPLVAENNGHTVQVTAAPGGTLTVGADVFTLKQFHFHAPSEHTEDGRHAPLEVHFVHADAAGNLAVLGLFVREGAPNAALGVLAEHAPHAKETKNAPADVTFDPSALLPGTLSTWRYSGSLTTPPCTEGVRWFVLENSVQASRDQLATFAEILAGNRRPTQPLHGRAVERVR